MLDNSSAGTASAATRSSVRPVRRIRSKPGLATESRATTVLKLASLPPNSTSPPVTLSGMTRVAQSASRGRNNVIRLTTVRRTLSEPDRLSASSAI